jgi:hypothetical protein
MQLCLSLYLYIERLNIFHANLTKMKKVYNSLGTILLLLGFSITVKAQPALGWGWGKAIGGTGSESLAAIAADSRNGVYVFGHFSGSINVDAQVLSSAGGSDLYLVKYDTTGNLLWAKRFGGTDNEEAQSLKTDKSGNLVFTGNFEGSVSFGSITLTSTGSSDVCIVKLQPNGNVIWAKQFTGSLADKGGALICDDQRNIYTTGTYLSNDLNIGGSSFTAPKSNNVFYCKLDSNGNKIWAKTTSSNVSSFSLYNFDLLPTKTLLMHGRMGPGGADNVNFNPPYSFPGSVGMLSFNQCVFTVKTDTAGNFISQSVTVSDGERADGRGTTLTTGKHVIKAGYTSSLSNPNPRALLYDCDTNNVLIRRKSYGSGSFGSTNLSDLYDIATGKNGKLYAVGFSRNDNNFDGIVLNSSNAVFLLLEIDDTLNVKNLLSTTGQANSSQALTQVADDTTVGTLFTAGYFSTTGSTFTVGNNVLPYYGSFDIFIGQVKYAPPLFRAYAGTDTTLCSGLGKIIGMQSGATGGTPPYSYSWSPTTGLANPTAASTLASPIATTSYILTVTDAFGNIAKDTAVITVITAPPTPTIIGRDTTICQGDTVTLTSNTLNNVGYYWYNGNINAGSTTAPIYKATETGNYILRLRSNATGCYSLPSQPVSVQVRPRPATPNITPNGPTTFCQGGSVTLSSSSASSYLWSTGATTSNITIGNSGNYTVRTADITGCKSLPSLPITTLVKPLPPMPDITQTGNTLTSSADTGNQWYLNGSPLSDAADQSYTYTTGGNYAVTVTNSDGCSSSSVILTALRMASNQLGNGIDFHHRVAPNPVTSSGPAILRYQLLAAAEVSVQITDRIGQQVLLLVRQQQQTAGIYNFAIGNRLQVLSRGLYYVVYNISGKRVVETVVIE